MTRRHRQKDYERNTAARSFPLLHEWAKGSWILIICVRCGERSTTARPIIHLHILFSGDIQRRILAYKSYLMEGFLEDNFSMDGSQRDLGFKIELEKQYMHSFLGKECQQSQIQYSDLLLRFVLSPMSSSSSYVEPLVPSRPGIFSLVTATISSYGL